MSKKLLVLREREDPLRLTDPKAIGLDGITKTDVTTSTIVESHLCKHSKCTCHVLFCPLSFSVLIGELGDNVELLDETAALKRRRPLGTEGCGLVRGICC